MTDFVLLYRTSDPAAMAERTPEEAERSMARWRAWFREMHGKGQLKTVGLPLQPTGKTVNGASKMITDGPYAESKEVVGGFSVILAKDAAEAARIARGCPVLEAGGSVEVRPVLDIPLDF